MNSEQRQIYNKEYYATNKERLAIMLLEKKTCPLCKRTVNHQNLPRHQKSKLCLSRRCEPEPLTKEDILELLNKLNNAT